MNNILTINNIVKRYGAITALNGISFHVPKGTVFGILGPNGSGKTTLLGILLDVLKADSGTFNWFDGTLPAEDARKKIGSLLETPNFYHYLNAEDNLAITATIRGYGHNQIADTLKTVGLYERRKSKFQTFSLGMKQRLAIAGALLGQPEILVLDEPTNGLDPKGITEIRELIIDLNRRGITIVIASHMLDEVEKVCTHLAILRKGEKLIDGSAAEILQNEDQIEVSANNLNELKAILSQINGIKDIKHSNIGYLLSHENWITAGDINKHCIEHGIVLNHLLTKKKSLETKFIEITDKQ